MPGRDVHLVVGLGVDDGHIRRRANGQRAEGFSNDGRGGGRHAGDQGGPVHQARVDQRLGIQA